jgi:hypothetical protein
MEEFLANQTACNSLIKELTNQKLVANNVTPALHVRVSMKRLV